MRAYVERMRCSGAHLSYNNGKVGIKRFSQSGGALSLSRHLRRRNRAGLYPGLQLCKPSDAIFMERWQDVLSASDRVSARDRT